MLFSIGRISYIDNIVIISEFEKEARTKIQS